tara:strand:- start:723 stop:7283 length:6561 start_codon:yes stop_codon:yes gene_type:complete
MTDGNNWQVTTLTPEELNYALENGGNITQPLIEVRGAKEDGSFVSLALGFIPEGKYTREGYNYLVERSMGPSGKYVNIYPEGSSISEIVPCYGNKAAALIDVLDSNENGKVDPSLVFYFDDAFHRKAAPKVVATNNRLKESGLWMLSVGMKRPWNRGPLMIGRGPQATAEFLKAVLPENNNDNQNLSFFLYFASVFMLALAFLFLLVIAWWLELLFGHRKPILAGIGPLFMVGPQGNTNKPLAAELGFSRTWAEIEDAAAKFQAADSVREQFRVATLFVPNGFRDEYLERATFPRARGGKESIRINTDALFSQGEIYLLYMSDVVFAFAESRFVRTISEENEVSAIDYYQGYHFSRIAIEHLAIVAMQESRCTTALDNYLIARKGAYTKDFAEWAQVTVKKRVEMLIEDRLFMRLLKWLTRAIYFEFDELADEIDQAAQELIGKRADLLRSTAEIYVQLVKGKSEEDMLAAIDTYDWNHISEITKRYRESAFGSEAKSNQFSLIQILVVSLAVVLLGLWLLTLRWKRGDSPTVPDSKPEESLLIVKIDLDKIRSPHEGATFVDTLNILNRLGIDTRSVLEASIVECNEALKELVQRHRDIITEYLSSNPIRVIARREGLFIMHDGCNRMYLTRLLGFKKVSAIVINTDKADSAADGNSSLNQNTDLTRTRDAKEISYFLEKILRIILRIVFLFYSKRIARVVHPIPSFEDEVEGHHPKIREAFAPIEDAELLDPVAQALAKHSEHHELALTLEDVRQGRIRAGPNWLFSLLDFLRIRLYAFNYRGYIIVNPAYLHDTQETQRSIIHEIAALSSFTHQQAEELAKQLVPFWKVLEGKSIPDTMVGIASLQKVGPVLGQFDTHFLHHPLEVLKMPRDSKMVIVEIQGSGICASDIPNLTTDSFASKHKISQTSLGHEGGGVIVAASPAVDSDILGKSVAIESHTPWIDFWDQAWYTRGLKKHSIIGYDPLGAKKPVSGIWAEYILLPLDNVYPLSEQVQAELNGSLSILEPTGNAVHTVVTLQQRLGSSNKQAGLIVVGLGTQGRMMMQIASSIGMRVVGIDARLESVKATIELGVGSDQTVFLSSDGNLSQKISDVLRGEADAIIDACGAQGVVETMTEYLKDKGLFILFGLAHQEQILPATGGLTLEAFVKGELDRSVHINDKDITLLGVCGRSQASWQWVIKHLEEDPDFAKLLLAGSESIGPLDELVKLLYPYNSGDRSLITGKMTRAKILMSGFSEKLRTSVFDEESLAWLFPESSKLRVISFSGKKTPLLRAVIKLKNNPDRQGESNSLSFIFILAVGLLLALFILFHFRSAIKQWIRKIRIIIRYHNYKKFLMKADALTLEEINYYFKEIESYLLFADQPLYAFARLPAQVRNAYYVLIVKGYENGKRIYLASEFLDLDESPRLYKDNNYDSKVEKLYRDPVKKVLDCLIDGDLRLSRKRLDIVDEGNDFSFSTVGVSIMSMLILNGLGPEDLNLNSIPGGPKFVATNAIKDYRDLSGDPSKHSLGNKFWPFTPNAAVKIVSFMRAFGVDAKYYDISTGATDLSAMLADVDENTIISYGFRDPVRYGDVVTAKQIAAYCALHFPDKAGPIISTGGIAVVSRQDLLSARVYVANDEKIIFKREPDASLESLPNRKVFDIFHRTYSETNILQLLFGYWLNKQWDDESGIAQEVAKLPNVWYYDQKSSDTPYACRVVYTSTRSLRRTIAVHGLWDFRTYDFRQFWTTMMTSPEKLHPKNRYFRRSMEHTTEHGDCTTGCDFCGYTGFVSLHAKIPVELAINNVKRAKAAYPGLEMIVYNDGNFLCNVKWAEEFFRRYKEEILPLGVTTFVQAPVYYCQDDSALAEMRDSGVEILCVGQEGCSMQFLVEIGKLRNSKLHHQFNTAPRKIAQSGIRWPRTSWIVFHPKKDQQEVMATIEEILEEIAMGIVTFTGAFAMCKLNSRLMRDKDEWEIYGKHTIKFEVQDNFDDDPFTSHLAFLPLDKTLREVSQRAVDELDTTIEQFHSINTIKGDMPEQAEIVLFFQLILTHLREHPGNEISSARIQANMSKTQEVLNYLFEHAVISPVIGNDHGDNPLTPDSSNHQVSPVDLILGLIFTMMTLLYILSSAAYLVPISRYKKIDLDESDTGLADKIYNIAYAHLVGQVVKIVYELDQRTAKLKPTEREKEFIAALAALDSINDLDEGA